MSDVDARIEQTSATVEIGCTIWWGDPNAPGGVDEALEDRIMQGGARGGVVYAVSQVHDPEAEGGLVDEFLLVRNHHGHPAYDAIRADHVGRIDPPDRRQLVGLLRLLAREVASGKGRQGLDERRAVDTIARLQKAVTE